MTIGSAIKKLRLKMELTQEQLAALLNISASAISQWETDRVLPDVTQIPVLANIFNVSADVILGIDIERKNEKINEILACAEQARYNGEFQKVTELLQDAYRQYPRSFQIMERLANALVNVYSRSGINDYDEVINLCNRILAECTDSMIRYKALETLGIAYNYAGKEDEMCKIADQMPPFRFCKEAFMLWQMKGDEGLKQRRGYLAALIYELCEAIELLGGHICDDGSFAYSIDDRITLWKQAVSIIEILYPDGDYQLIAQNAECACKFIVSAYLHKDDFENSIYWLEKVCDYVIHFDTYDFNAEHTSPALRGYSSGGWIMEDGCNHSADMLDAMLNDEMFDKIRSDPRFEAIISRLKKVAKKP